MTLPRTPGSAPLVLMLPSLLRTLIVIPSTCLKKEKKKKKTKIQIQFKCATYKYSECVVNQVCRKRVCVRDRKLSKNSSFLKFPPFTVNDSNKIPGSKTIANVITKMFIKVMFTNKRVKRMRTLKEQLGFKF